jgi:hypothetical protein
MAGPTRRRHGHVAGLRRRPFSSADVDTPNGVIEELDEDDAIIEPVDAAVDPEDAGDAVAAEPAAEDVPRVSEPAEAGAELVVEEEPTAEATAEVGSASPAAEAEIPEDTAEADTTAEDEAEDEPAQGEAVEDSAEGDESTPDPPADLLAWLAGDGESIADLVAPEKRTQTYVAAGPPAVGPGPRPLARPPRLDRQSFRRAADAPRVAPPAPPAPPVSGGPPPGPPPRPGRRRRMVFLVTAVVVAAALVAGVVALLLPGSGTKYNGTSSQPSSTAAIPPPVRAIPPPVRTTAIPLVAWVKENLPSNAAMIAPAALVRSLQGAGFTAVHADHALTGLTLANVSYLVGEPAAATPYSPLEMFINATAPLAYFGTGSAQTMVGVVFRGGTAAMSAALVADTKLRAQEGSDLLDNPNVHMDAAMRTVLAKGLLDTRAGALIGALARARQVTITDPQRAAPETAAGLPYRTFTISMADTVVLDNAVRRAGPKYRPATAVAVGPTQRRLTWTPAIAPDRPLS